MKRIKEHDIKQIFLSHFTEQYGEEAAKELLEQLPDCRYAKAIAQAQLEANRKEYDEDIGRLMKEIHYLSNRIVDLLGQGG